MLVFPEPCVPDSKTPPDVGTLRLFFNSLSERLANIYCSILFNSLSTPPKVTTSLLYCISLLSKIYQ